MKTSITPREARKPADAANRSDLPPPSCAGDDAAQTAGTSRSAVFAKHAAPLALHQQASPPALENLQPITSARCIQMGMWAVEGE